LSIVQTIGESDGSKEDNFSGNKGISMEPNLGDKGMDLFDMDEGLATSQQRQALQLVMGHPLIFLLKIDLRMMITKMSFLKELEISF